MYNYPGIPIEEDDTLHDAGCGIFSVCHLIDWITGEKNDVDELAQFSMDNGGRGDDGTDRPALLHALMAHGKTAEIGFRYEEDGLRNDLDALYDHLLSGRGVSMCNLRVGHIVALVAAREADGRRQVLAIDSYSESASEKVRDHVIEVLPGSEVAYDVKNQDGLVVGHNVAYAAF